MSGGRIVGLGAAAAGDDGVGPAVIAHLRGGDGGAVAPGDVELCAAREPTELVTLLCHPGAVVLVDAVVGAPAGAVQVIAPDALDPAAAFAASSHGLGVAAAIALARTLAGAAFTPRLHLVAVAIAAPARGRAGLCPSVAAAVPRAAALALALARR